MLHINEMTYRIGGRVLFDAATVAITPGMRVGFIGRNGAGKSTLFRLILGETSSESGSLKPRPNIRIGHVAQEAPGGDQSVIETVLAAHAELQTLEAELAQTSGAHRIAEIHERLRDLGAHTAKARAATILAGLGLDAAVQEGPCSALSGGWRMRVALASVLYLEPDLLLLDEPTNYLDLEGVIWLENFLAKYRHTVIVISHDRDLLNRSVNAILHLDQGKLTLYRGGYDDFAAEYQARAERQMKMKDAQEAERKRLQGFVDRFRAKASKAKQAQSRLKRLEKMTPVVMTADSRSGRIAFEKPDIAASPMLTIEDGSAGYGEKTVLKRLDIRLDQDDRIALLGPNGNGKTTFAKIIQGLHPLMGGKLRRVRDFRPGYFAQHQLDVLPEGATPYQLMAAKMPGATEAKVRASLGVWGFGADFALRRIESFSGGEKARLLLSLIAAEKPNLLILDEPTNHLDMDGRAQLIDALNAFEGAVLFISHDRHFVESCADRLWLVANGAVSAWRGDMDDYAAEVMRARKASPENSGPKTMPKSDERREKAENRARIAPLRKTAETAEAKLKELTDRKKLVEAALANPILYDSANPRAVAKLKELTEEAAQLSEAVMGAEDEWFQAHEALEQAEFRN